jgi:transcriptional regulator with XRE-family HTH domain
MDYDEKQRLARTGDVSNAAASFRLRAARETLEPRISQKAMAERLGVPQTTYASWETGDAYPPPTAIRHFRREYEFSFDFIMYGDWRRLPGDVRERVFDAMLALEAKTGRRSDRG